MSRLPPVSFYRYTNHATNHTPIHEMATGTSGADRCSQCCMRRCCCGPIITPIHVAYFPDPVKIEALEIGYPSPAVLALLHDAEISYRQIGLEELLGGCLMDESFTALCVPGGFAPNYLSRLGSLGAMRIREFIDAGGGYIGLCAGAFLGSSAGLSLVEVDVDDIHRWARGSGPCQVIFTDAGSLVLGALGPSHGPVTVRYRNGPLMRPRSCDVLTLATFATEFRARHDSLAEGTQLNGTPAICVGRAVSAGCAACGGVVALVSPHLEDGEDARSLTPLANLIRFCSRGSLYQMWLLGSGGSAPGSADGARDGAVVETWGNGELQSGRRAHDELHASAEHNRAIQAAADVQIRWAEPEVARGGGAQTEVSSA